MTRNTEIFIRNEYKQIVRTLMILFSRILPQARLDMDENVHRERQFFLNRLFDFFGKFMAFVDGNIRIDMNMDIGE